MLKGPQCHRWWLSYLKVFKRNPPLIGRIFGGARGEQGPAVVGDGLAAVRVLSGSINVSAAVECGFGAVVLQLHGVQREPAASGHLVVTLTHDKAGCTQTHGENSSGFMEVTGGDSGALCPLVSLNYRAEGSKFKQNCWWGITFIYLSVFSMLWTYISLKSRWRRTFS